MNAAPPYPIASTGARSGLIYLRDTIRQYFADNGIGAEVAGVGLKYRNFTLNQSFPANAQRVVLIPGIFDGDLQPKPRPYGTLSRENRNASYVVNPRELLTWSRIFTFSIWSAPIPGQVENEEGAVGAAEDLLEQVVRATQYAGAATIQWGDVIIQSPPNEQSFGVELLVAATQIGPLLDMPMPIVQPVNGFGRSGVKET